jgi:hypothetical protein
MVGVEFETVSSHKSKISARLCRVESATLLARKVCGDWDTDSTHTVPLED